MEHTHTQQPAPKLTPQSLFVTYLALVRYRNKLYFSRGIARVKYKDNPQVLEGMLNYYSNAIDETNTAIKELQYFQHI